MTKLLNRVEDQHYIRQTSPLLSESVFLKLDESLFLALYIVSYSEFFASEIKQNTFFHVKSLVKTLLTSERYVDDCFSLLGLL